MKRNEDDKERKGNGNGCEFGPWSADCRLDRTFDSPHKQADILKLHPFKGKNKMHKFISNFN